MILRRSQIFSLASIIWSIIKRHDEFVCERLKKCEVSLTDSIKRVALHKFAKRSDTKSEDNKNVNALKKDVP